MHRLINYHAQRGAMLFRAPAELYEKLRNFVVAENDGKVIGCCALEVLWSDLAEIKSLAVDTDASGAGIGRVLVEHCLSEAHRLGVQRVFTLTRVPGFFEKLNFIRVDKDSLPHKVWADCHTCPIQDQCDETALIRE